MKSAWRILGSIAVLFVSAFVFLQGSGESSTPVAAQELSFSVSEPVTPFMSVAVRDLPTGNAQRLLDREINPLKNPHLLSEGMGIKGSNTIGLDPLAELSRRAETGNTPSPIFTFEGLGTDGFTPPDTVGDVGPNHYVQMINVSFAIWEKNANPNLPPSIVQEDTLFNALFAGYGGVCQTQNDGDPIVVYDDLADRWLLSQFADPAGSHTMCIAISQTPDPTGAYYLYDFQTPQFPDYFKFGVWSDGYYMSTNTGAPNQYYAFAFDREKMLAGQPATFQAFGGYPNFMMPSDLDGNTPPPAGSPNYFYTFFDGDYPDHPAGVDRLALYEFDVDWESPTNTSFTLVQELPIAAYNYTVCGFFVGNCIPQPGTGQGLDSLSYWPMFRFAYRNLGSHEAMVGNFTVDLDGSDKAAIRWFELRKAGAVDWALHQEGTHAPDADHRWMGSIAMDGSGNIALGYSVSSASTFPAIRYATRLANDPLGTLQAEASIIEGGGSQTAVHRWGDYSAMSIDPADDCTFWYTTEYHDVDDAGFDWQTRIGTFRLDSCGTADFTFNASPPEQDVCLPNEVMFNVTVGQVQEYDDEVALTANNLPGSVTADFSVNPVTPSTPPATSTLTISNSASVAAGSYTVELMGTALTSTHTTTIGINIFDSTPLSATLTSPADGATGASLVATFEWTAPAQGTDYYLEVASDMAFATVVYSATVDSSSHQMAAALEPLTPYYWRVRADNLCGEGAVSAIWSFTTADIPPILVVDDDDNSPDVQSSYTDVLDALGQQYDVWDTSNSDNEPSAVDLAPYSMVIWFTGDSFGGSAGPGSAGEAALSAFLDGGQCLFISSQDYVYDRGITPFMQDYLGIASASSDVGQATVTGEGILFGGLGPYSLSYPFSNYSDILRPDATAELAFSGNVGDAAVDKDSGVYRTTFWGFPFEALPTATDQQTVMQTVIDWCGTGIATGTLEGTVTDADSGDGIEGATITADDGSNQRSTTTDENGDYTMRLAIGSVDVIAAADMYVSEMISDVVIVTDTTSTADFVLQGSSLTYSPAEIEEDMEIGNVVTTTVTVTATGPLDVDFAVSIGNFAAPSLQQSPISIPASDGHFERGSAAPSIGQAAQSANVRGQNPDESLLSLLSLLGAPAYGVDLLGDTFISFTTDAPANTTTIASGVSQNFYAGDFLAGDFSTLYAIDNRAAMLYAIDSATGGMTAIGPSLPSSGQSWTGMAGDPTSGMMYAVSTDCSANTIYTIDIATGTPTVVGTASGACIIDIAIGPAGDMYGLDIIADDLLAIDKTTGAVTTIGAIGFDASFAQDMDFDEEANILYLAAYNAAISTAELRLADTTTGNTTLVGTIAAGELDAFGIATGGSSGGATNWAHAVPNSGTVPANGTTTFDVVFDARSLIQVGDYTAELSFSGNFVNDVDTMPLTMNLTCPTCGFLDGSITDLVTGEPVNAQLHVTSTNGFDVMLTGESYQIAVQPGTYNITVSANGYFDESASVVATQGTTVTTDFVLTPTIAMLEYTPASIEESMEIGDIVSNTVTVQNTGYVDLEFNVNIGGYEGPTVQLSPLGRPHVEGQGEWLYRSEKGVESRANLGDKTRLAYPKAYRWQPDVPRGVNVLLYADGFIHNAPNTYPDQALQALGIAYTAHYDNDWAGFEVSLTGGTWDMVIVAADSFGAPTSALTALDDYVTNGGKLALHNWNIAANSSNPLWTSLGFTWVSDEIAPPDPVYWWQAGHPIFNMPESVPEFTMLDSIGFLVYGQHVEPLPGFEALAGYTTPGPDPNEVALIVGNDGRTVFKGFLDGHNSADLDSDTVPDGAELWLNLIAGLQNGFGGSSQWASAVPDSGIVPAGETMTFDVVFDARSLFQTGDHTANLSFSGNFVNDVDTMPLTMNLTCPTCGFLDGSITDLVTGDAVNAQLHVTSTNGFDVMLSGESYEIAVQPGTYNFTVSANGYLDESASVVATQGTTVTTDFVLTPTIAMLEYTPASIEESMEIGDIVTNTVTVQNTGYVDLEFNVNIGGYEGPTVQLSPLGRPHVEGQGEWLYRSEKGVESRANLGDKTRLAYPKAYRWQPDVPRGVNVLLYADGFIHNAPNTYPDQALQALGIAYTAHYDNDWAGFEVSLTGGTWDMVIVAADSFGAPTSALTALDDYVTNGGKLALHNWNIAANPSHALWTSLGFTWVSDVFEPPAPVYWWQAGHPIFNMPESVPEFTMLDSIGFFIYGQDVEPLPGFEALAGYTTPGPDPNEAALIVGNDGRTVFKGFLDGQNSADLDTDTVPDGAELWINLIAGLQNGFGGSSQWASAVPDSGIVPAGETMTFDVVFDARSLFETGDYTANLSFSGNFVNDVETMPLTMHISCPTCGLLEGSITDAFTAAPLSANINVMGDETEINITGDSYSLALPAGDYDLTISANDYFSETATVSAVMGETTVTDFALTPMIAVLDYMPDSFEQTIAIGDMLTQELVIENDGTIAFDFALSDIEIGTPDGTMVAPMITCPEDEFGYSCTDSNEPGGPTYDFEDISATGTDIFLGDDQVSAPIPLGFIFNFYEEDYSDIYVSSNGFLTVLAGQFSGCCSGQPIPTAGNPDGVIAGWWEDLNPSSGGTIHYETLGTAPNRRLIVQFTSVPHYGGGNQVTMQYKLFEGSNIIEVHYQDAPSDGNLHSAGIENQDGTSGVQYHYGSDGLVTPLAVRYQTYQDALWLEQEPMTGTVEADDSMMIEIIFNATEITQTGTYTASLRLEGTFDNEGAQITVVMHVEDPDPEIEVEVEQPEITLDPSQEMSQTLTISNTGNTVIDWQAFSEESTGQLVLAGTCSGENPSLDWIELASTNGTIQPGGIANLEMTADATGLEPGTYTGNLCVRSAEQQLLLTRPMMLTVNAETMTPTPTNTPTASASTTPTASATPTNTPTASASATPTATASTTPTASATATASATPTASATATASPTPTKTGPLNIYLPLIRK